MNNFAFFFLFFSLSESRRRANSVRRFSLCFLFSAQGKGIDFFFFVLKGITVSPFRGFALDISEREQNHSRGPL